MRRRKISMLAIFRNKTINHEKSTNADRHMQRSATVNKKKSPGGPFGPGPVGPKKTWNAWLNHTKKQSCNKSPLSKRAKVKFEIFFSTREIMLKLFGSNKFLMKLTNWYISDFGKCFVNDVSNVGTCQLSICFYLVENSFQWKTFWNLKN